jgi:fructose-1,6-bisphosphatase/inositol monophosphatase family enzyme
VSSDTADRRHGSAEQQERRFIEVFSLAARQAGCVAQHLQAEIRAHTKEGALSPEAAALTAVDLAAQDLILLLLHDAFPEAAVDAEEETSTTALFPAAAPQRPLIVLDPIDGTLNYSRGSPDFAVMGAWLRDGAYRAALVYFPRWGELYWTREGIGCWRQRDGGEPEPVRAAGPRDRVLVHPQLPAAWLEALRAAGFVPEISHCSAVDATAPLSRRGAAAVSLGPHSRRRPTALYLTLQAGGTVLFRDRPWQGEDVIGLCGPGDPIISAADAELAEQLLRIVS